MRIISNAIAGFLLLCHKVTNQVKTQRAFFKVVGMYCSSCKAIVEKQLEDEKAVKKIDFFMLFVVLLARKLNILYQQVCMVI